MNTSAMKKPASVGLHPALVQITVRAMRSAAAKVRKLATHSMHMPTITPSKRGGWIQ